MADGGGLLIALWLCKIPKTDECASAMEWLNKEWRSIITWGKEAQPVRSLNVFSFVHSFLGEESREELASTFKFPYYAVHSEIVHCRCIQISSSFSNPDLFKFSNRPHSTPHSILGYPGRGNCLARQQIHADKC